MRLLLDHIFTAFGTHKRVLTGSMWCTSMFTETHQLLKMHKNGRTDVQSEQYPPFVPEVRLVKVVVPELKVIVF